MMYYYILLCTYSHVLWYHYIIFTIVKAVVVKLYVTSISFLCVPVLVLAGAGGNKKIIDRELPTNLWRRYVCVYLFHTRICLPFSPSHSIYIYYISLSLHIYIYT